MSFVMRPKALEKLARHYAGDTGVQITTDTTCTVPITNLKSNRIILPGWVHPDDLGALLGGTLHETGHVKFDRPHYKLAAKNTMGGGEGGNFAILANVLQDIRLDCDRFKNVPAARALYTKLYARCPNDGKDLDASTNAQLDASDRCKALIPLLQGMIMESTGFGARNGRNMRRVLKTHRVWQDVLTIARSVIGTETSLVPETMKLRKVLDAWLDNRQDRNGKTQPGEEGKPEPGDSGPRAGKTRRSSGEASSDKRCNKREELADPSDKERQRFEDRANAVDAADKELGEKRAAHSEVRGQANPDDTEEAQNAWQEALDKSTRDTQGAEADSLSKIADFNKQCPPHPRNYSHARNRRTIDAVMMPGHIGPGSLHEAFDKAPLLYVDVEAVTEGYVKEGLKRFLETTEFDGMEHEAYKVNPDALADVFTDPDSVLVSPEHISRGYDTHVQFILDVSGSMNGQRADMLVTALKAIKQAAQRLGVMRCTTSATWFSSGAHSTKIEDLDSATWELVFGAKHCVWSDAFTAQIEAEYNKAVRDFHSTNAPMAQSWQSVVDSVFQPWHGTRADLGAKAALKTLETVDASRKVVIFMTDGAVGVAGWVALKRLAAMPDVVVNTLGLGTRRGSQFLGEYADIQRIRHHVESPGDLLLKLSEMLDEGSERE